MLGGSGVAKLAIIFPGIGYTCDKPLLYYADTLADQMGYEVKRILYTLPGGTRIRGNLEKMEEAFRTLYASAEECLSIVDWKQYDEMVFFSKSIGTVIAAAYASRLSGMAIRHVFYTPLEYTFDHHPKNAIGFLGTADSWCVPNEVLRRAREQGIPMHVYEGANHSLETGDTLADLDTIKDVMEKTKRFLQG
jgi:phosphoglycolate phosphatase